MDAGQVEEAVNMTTRVTTKYVHEGQYAAAVSVRLIDDETAWAPYLSQQDAYKLDDVRQALRARDLETAARLASVYEMKPVAVQ